MKHVAIAMIVLLLAGIAFGAGGSTLYWSGQVTRQFRAQAEWKALVDKQSVTIREQGDALRNLTAATGRLIDATKPR